MSRLLTPRGEPEWHRQFRINLEQTLLMPEHAKAKLPPASGAKRWIYVTDEIGGAVPAFNDGTNWRRATDRAIVS